MNSLGDHVFAVVSQKGQDIVDLGFVGQSFDDDAVPLVCTCHLSWEKYGSGWLDGKDWSDRRKGYVHALCWGGTSQVCSWVEASIQDLAIELDSMIIF